jgi:hypothetical protein
MRALLGHVTPSPKKMASGMALVGAGVAWLTLNERRDVAAGKLRLKAEMAAVSLAQNDVENVDGTLNNRLLHYQGTLKSDAPPVDYDFGVTNPALVAIRRRVEMYQWRESKHERVHKDGSKEVTYSYEKVWSTRHEVVENAPDKRNPDFPSDLPGGSHVFHSEGIHVGLIDKLLLNDGMIDQLTDFKPLALSRDYVRQDGQPFPHQLVPTRTRMAFSSGKGYFDAVGDLRVSFEGLFTGPYTAVAKVVFGEDKKKYLEPWAAKLSQSLASQGEIRLPKNANEILGVELDSFIIPEAVINWAESALLSMAPLHINYIAPDTKSLKACMQGIAMKDMETLNSMRMAGGGVIFLGCLSLMPRALQTTSAGMMSAFVATLALSFQTIKEAKPKKIRPLVLSADKPDVEL